MVSKKRKEAKKPDIHTTGYLSDIRGRAFEDEVQNRLKRKYDFEILTRRPKIYGKEIDILAKEKGWGGRLILIECKAKEKIRLVEFTYFRKKLERYRKANSKAIGIFAYRGKLEEQLTDYLEEFYEFKHDKKIPIYLERFR